MNQLWLLLIVSFLWPAASPAETADRTQSHTRSAATYESAVVDADGRLVVTTSSRKKVVINTRGDQTSFSTPVLSADRTAVGAQAEFRNCCTSYDVPLQLVVYADGKVHRFSGIGLPIFDWHFVDGGARIAYGQQTVHFACSIHYELRDVRSERLIDSADVAEPCGQNPKPETVALPEWVSALRSESGR
jgi:hypothetical protein